MQDFIPKKPRRESGVNMTLPGLTAWDHVPGDRDPRWYRGRGTDEETVLEEVNQPSSYERLTDQEKTTLQEWIAKELVTASLAGSKCSYALKHIHERLTRHYVTNGQFKGAMLAAGYEPIDRTELNWQFRYVFTDTQLLDRSLGRVLGGKVA